MSTFSKVRLKRKSTAPTDSHAPSKWAPIHKRIEIRFPCAEDHAIVVQAAHASGLSINGWLVRAVAAAARAQLDGKS